MLLALAATLTLMQAQHASAELVTSITAVKPGEPFLAGVVIRTDPGWHVYWANPGDSGQATSIEWKLPEGWKAGEILWPTPSKFAEQEMTTFGYEGSTILLTKITPPAGASKGRVVLEAKVRWLACQEACVPGSADLRLDRSVTENTYDHPVWSERLKAAERSLPQPLEGWSFEANPVEGGFVLKTKPAAPLEKGNSLPVFYSMDSGVIEMGAPQNFRLNEDGSFWIAIKSSTFLDKQPERLRGILLAPKMMKWTDEVDAVLVDVPITLKGDS